MKPIRLGKFETFGGKVIERDSRVTAIIKEEGRELRAHLRNTGRLEDLIYPGVSVICERKEGGKTDARILGAIGEGSPVLLDTLVQERGFSKAANKGAFELLPSSPENSSPLNKEVTYEDKRFDFGIRKEGGETGYLELKSAVTCRDGWASYPDAPSRRGLEHVKLLGEIAAEGRPAYIAFIVTHPECSKFRPNREIQPKMAEALRTAENRGVEIFAVKIILTEKGTVKLTDSDLRVRIR